MPIPCPICFPYFFFSFQKGGKIERKIKEENCIKKSEIGIGKGA